MDYKEMNSAVSTGLFSLCTFSYAIVQARTAVEALAIVALIVVTAVLPEVIGGSQKRKRKVRMLLALIVLYLYMATGEVHGTVLVGELMLVGTLTILNGGEANA